MLRRGKGRNRIEWEMARLGRSGYWRGFAIVDCRCSNALPIAIYDGGPSILLQAQNGEGVGKAAGK